MKDWFSPISINVNIEFILALLGIIIGLASTSVFKRKKPNKRLSVKQSDNDAIVDIRNGFKEDVTILYKSKPVGNLYQVTIYIENEGAQSLREDDFHKSPLLDLGNIDLIHSVVLESNDEFTKCKAEINRNNKVEFKVELLEPEKYIKIIVLYESSLEYEIDDFKNKYYFETYVIEGNRERNVLNYYSRIEYFVGASKDSNFVMILMILAGALTFIVEVFIVDNSLGINTFNNDFKINIPLGWFSILFILPIIISVLIFRTILYNRQPWLNIKNWVRL